MIQATPTSRRSSATSAPSFLLSWLKVQGIDDALIQPYSGHEHRQSPEVYSRPSLADLQQCYDEGHRPPPGLSAPR
jgi:integrase/recombinase XerD